MISKSEAREIVAKDIQEGQPFGNEDTLVIVDAKTIDKPYGWIFFYTSKRWLETQDFKYAIAGNGPKFVSSNDGQIKSYPTGMLLEQMIEAYEKFIDFQAG